MSDADDEISGAVNVPPSIEINVEKIVANKSTTLTSVTNQE